MYIKIILLCLLSYCNGQFFITNNRFKVMTEVFAWKQISYDLNGIKYTKDAVHKKSLDAIYFKELLDEKDSFFIQYNNIPIGLEVYQEKVFITVPRRRYGIISTLNYVDLSSETPSAPLLKPYPDESSISTLVSVYRPRVDVCGRLWAVDTGLLEVPGHFEQKKSPQIIIYDLKTNKLILTYDIPSTLLVNETTSGLTSITVDVTASTCDDAYAYVTDLAKDGLIVFSLAQRTGWRISHESFSYDVGATDFIVANHKINWKDGIFSVALSDPNDKGDRTAYYHPFISTQEFSVSTNFLKTFNASVDMMKLEGVRGPFSQSGSHDFHSDTQALLYANVAQDGIMCWNTKIPLTSKNTALIAQDRQKLVYITDLKIVGDDVWVLVNQIPRFIYSKLNTNETNFYVHKGKVQDLIKDSVCDVKK